MILLTVSQAERYFCPYRKGNCIPHECMAWKYVDECGYCYKFENSIPTNEPIKQKETILLQVNGYNITIAKPELSIRIVKDHFVQIFSDECREANIDRQEWERRESRSSMPKRKHRRGSMQC